MPERDEHTAPAAGARQRQAPREAAETDLGLLPGLLGYQLRLAQRSVFDDFQRSIGEPDVSPGLFGILVIIEANPGLKQTDLARAAMLDRSTMVPALDKLEARGLVARRPPPQDRRVNGLWLTADGATLVRRLKRRVLAHERRLTGELGAGERAQLLELLGRLAAKGRAG
jgi:DNA-binding MarR family transcriptional regulator